MSLNKSVGVYLPVSESSALIDRHEYDIDLGRHYSEAWGQNAVPHVWNRGPALPRICRVLEFAPSDKTFCWVYATCGMSPVIQAAQMELFMLSPCQTEGLVELLTAVAHYHQTEAMLGLGHTVNFGRPWLEKSECAFGLISLPYPFGPSLENAVVSGTTVRVLWLLPITCDERAYQSLAGVNALEDMFERERFDYLDPMRASVVPKQG